VACVWRRQTFSAAVESFSPEMSKHIFLEHIPTLIQLLSPSSGNTITAACISILESAFAFSRMLHGSQSISGGTSDAFYRAFVPEPASTLYPRQIELVKRCLKCERGDLCRVGATISPGLVKVTGGPVTPSGEITGNVQTVVRRAQVICDCALGPACVSAASASGASGSGL
jgi:hypothetical protein